MSSSEAEMLAGLSILTVDLPLSVVRKDYFCS